ncbi:hypothetical protein VTG60DRAFT_4135 [Thermothelomyces hinnuleus]
MMRRIAFSVARIHRGASHYQEDSKRHGQKSYAHNRRVRRIKNACRRAFDEFAATGMNPKYRIPAHEYIRALRYCSPRGEANPTVVALLCELNHAHLLDAKPRTAPVVVTQGDVPEATKHAIRKLHDRVGRLEKDLGKAQDEIADLQDESGTDPDVTRRLEQLEKSAAAADVCVNDLAKQRADLKESMELLQKQMAEHTQGNRNAMSRLAEVIKQLQDARQPAPPAQKYGENRETATAPRHSDTDAFGPGTEAAGAAQAEHPQAGNAQTAPAGPGHSHTGKGPP